MSEQFGHSISPPANKNAGNGPELPEFVIGRRTPVKNPGIAAQAPSSRVKAHGDNAKQTHSKPHYKTIQAQREGPILGGGSGGSGGRTRRKKLNRARFLLFAAVTTLCLMLGLLIYDFLSSPPIESINDDGAQSTNSDKPDSGKFFSGVSVDGFDIGNLTYAQAKSKVEPSIAEKLESIRYSLSLEGKEYTLDHSDLKANIDYEAVLHEAFDVGRGNSALENINEQTKAKNGGFSFDTVLTFSREALDEKLEEIGAEAYVAPIEPHAVVNTERGDRFKFEEGTNGKQIDTGALAEKIETLLLSGQYSAEIEVPTSVVQPKHTIDDVRKNTTKISSFTTYFTSSAGSKPERVFNIEKTANIIDGAEMKPGEEWSFNDHVGPRTLEGGWKEAPGIVNGNMYEMQAGGGICQVSTTLYNAVLKADLEIESSRRHSWPSAYVDYGLDATVSTGGPDLVIKNNKDYSVFVFASVNADEKSVTVTVYGQNTLDDGVSIQLHSEIKEEIEPPEPKIHEDSEMPTGYKETVIEERTGYVCDVYRNLVRNGEVVKSEVLYTHKYKAVQGELRIGTGDKTSLDPVPPNPGTSTISS